MCVCVCKMGSEAWGAHPTIPPIVHEMHWPGMMLPAMNGVFLLVTVMGAARANIFITLLIDRTEIYCPITMAEEKRERVNG